MPGDIVLLVGGCAVPADVEWLEGDVLSIDTAALTGEPLPRKYPSEQYGPNILCGCTVKAGEAYCIVRHTGINTEVGSSSADIMNDKATTKVSVFEERVLFAVKIIIMLSLIDVAVIFLVQGFLREEFQGDVKELILTCLSIIIAAVPVALPLVLQVTMALGAAKMATEFNAVVTSLPALQDISSMSVLCSDKTGTLTTANISIHAESVWTAEGFTKDDVALYGALSSNRDKKEDPIDRSVINHFDTVAGPSGLDKCAEFSKVRLVGFNPIYKRVVAEFTHPALGTVTIAKGLPAKILDTADGVTDDALDQWKVEGFSELKPVVDKVDLDFSRAGYKTLGIAVKINDGPFKYVGILPMLDPPRHDTSVTIENLTKAGVNVKMITGDHLNIAKETARLIGMGTNIHPGEATRDASECGKELIFNADGFAQVMPKDKRECVMVLKNHFDIVTGMTGDGVNDAPALSAAQCGIAVDDATDAAKNAAAIILTSPGLSAIYSAVVESRRIFRKLKAYVTYRFAATIQIVIVLTLFIFISDCPINSLYVILLALFNDLTMLPIAYDNQQASAIPENPEVQSMLLLSLLLGLLETAFSVLFAYGASSTGGLLQAEYEMGTCDKKMQAAVWLQMSIAAELLIFSARAPSFILTSIAPSKPLTVSVIMGCLITTVLAGAFKYFGELPVKDMVWIWVYDLVCLAIIDMLKVMYLRFMGASMEVLPDDDSSLAAPSASRVSHDQSMRQRSPSKSQQGGMVDALIAMHDEEGADVSHRASASLRQMHQWNESKSGRVPTQYSYSRGGDRALSFRGSSMRLHRSRATSDAAPQPTFAQPSSAQSYSAANSIAGRSLLAASGSLRPNVPAFAAKSFSHRR